MRINEVVPASGDKQPPKERVHEKDIFPGSKANVGVKEGLGKVAAAVSWLHKPLIEVTGFLETGIYPPPYVQPEQAKGVTERKKEAVGQYTESVRNALGFLFDFVSRPEVIRLLPETYFTQSKDFNFWFNGLISSSVVCMPIYQKDSQLTFSQRLHRKYAHAKENDYEKVFWLEVKELKDTFYFSEEQQDSWLFRQRRDKSKSDEIVFCEATRQLSFEDIYQNPRLSLGVVLAIKDILEGVLQNFNTVTLTEDEAKTLEAIAIAYEEATVEMYAAVAKLLQTLPAGERK